MAPVNTSLPVVSGATVVGQELACSPGTWGNSPISFAYQWRRNGDVIDGASSATYTLLEIDEGAEISCTVTATNVDGFASATSATVGPVTQPSTEVEFDFSGGSLAEGATLERASSGWCFNSSGLLTSVGSDTARFDHSLDGDFLGLLVEVQRINRVAWSTGIGAHWNKGANSTVTDGAAVGLDGVAANADRCVHLSGSGSFVNTGIGLGDAAGVLIACSAYAKLWDAGTPCGHRTEISSTLFTVDVINGEAELTIDWQLIYATAVSDGEGTANSIQLQDKDGAGGDELIGHAQAEVFLPGEYPVSSPIPTSGSATTRAADVLTLDLADGVWDLGVATPNGTFEGSVIVSGGEGYAFDWADLSGATAERHVRSITATAAE